MLYPRIIPCLLIHNRGLVKTIGFKDPKYVGDPINTVKIFNEKEVDELIVIDIDASKENREPDYRMIENLAVECRMPFCYVGGIKSVEQAQRIFSLGVEKIGISSVAIENPSVVTRMAEHVGNQSVVIVMDVKKKSSGGKYEIWIYNATMNTKIDPVKFAQEMEERGAGEIVINSIDLDGTLKGYDLNIIQQIYESINIPLTVLGGAGSLNDIGAIIRLHGGIGSAAGSWSVSTGKYKAVLINYPDKTEKEELIKKYFLPGM